MDEHRQGVATNGARANDHSEQRCSQDPYVLEEAEKRWTEHDIRERLKALDFLKRASDGKHRIVSSGDLTAHQIAEAQANGKFYVEPGGGLGWALLPWELTTDKDRMRAGLACASDPKP